MKKLFYLIAAFAFVFSGPMMASADRVLVPMTYHYGSSSTSVDNFTAIFVKNLSSAAMKVTIYFQASTKGKFYRGSDTLSGSTTTTSGGSTTVTTNGLAKNAHSGKNVTATIPAYGVWNVRTDDTNVWATTSNQMESVVEIESSGTDNPYVESTSTITSTGFGIDGAGAGPIAVNAAFVSAQSEGPSGFVLPVYYRVRSWAGVVGTSTTTDNWGQ